MALCRQPGYNNLTCHQYPIDQNFACQDYLGGKYIYASNKTLDKATLSVTFNGEIIRLENLLNLQLQGDSSCLEYFKLLICYYFYPLCLSNYGSSVWSKNRKSVALLVFLFEVIYVQVKLTYWQNHLNPNLLSLTKNSMMVSNPY